MWVFMCVVSLIQQPEKAFFWYLTDIVSYSTPFLWVFPDETEGKVKILYGKDEIIIFSFMMLHEYELLPNLGSIMHCTERQ